MDKKSYLKLLKAGCKMFKIAALITLSLFLIPVIMIFETNVYDMELLAILFTVSYTANIAYYITIDKIVCRFIENTKEKSIDKFQIFNSISCIGSIDVINIIFNGLVLLSYFICLMIADIPFLTRILYFLLIPLPLVGIPTAINTYMNNYYKLNNIIRKYYDSILNS